MTGGHKVRRPAARRELVFRALDDFHAWRRVHVLIHGDADHTDTFAGEWARSRGIKELAYPIRPGESGFDRNGRMLLASRPDLVLHFPGANGTADMVARARAAGVPVQGALERRSPQLELFSSR